MVTEKPDYGENYVSEVKIHFGILQEPIPEWVKDLKLVVYRLEIELDPKEPGKATKLGSQFQLAKAVISKKYLEKHFWTVKTVAARDQRDDPMDIAIPLFKDSSVTIGIVRMASTAMSKHRESLTRHAGVKPYSETLYSFCTNSGQTMSLEQLYVSKYSVSVASALVALWRGERQSFMKDTMLILQEEYKLSFNEHVERVRSTILPGESAEDKTALIFEPFKQTIETIAEILSEEEAIAEVALDSCARSVAAKELVNNVISHEIGGQYLRRSTWKKITAWQYMTTNLNLHMLTSKSFHFSELASAGEEDEVYVRDPKKFSYRSAYSANASNYHQHMHYSPSITLGCPAAHALKFSDGGLRKIFVDIPDTAQKLKWMHAIQLPNLEYIKQLMIQSPKEFSFLFGRNGMLSKEDIAAVLKRKNEICRRIDMVASQALGFAVTVVKTICFLAAEVGDKYMSVLQRSIRTGFLLMFESMLSSQGDELGMIEDLEMAALWLSLVTVRLVMPVIPKHDTAASSTDNCNGSSTSGDETATMKQDGGDAVDVAASTSKFAKLFNNANTESSKVSDDSEVLLTGVGEGVSCFRNKVIIALMFLLLVRLMLFFFSNSLFDFFGLQAGRLTVDIEVTEKEAAAIVSAQTFMSDFDKVCTTQILPSDCPFAFKPVPQWQLERDPTAASKAMRAFGNSASAKRSSVNTNSTNTALAARLDIRGNLMQQQHRRTAMKIDPVHDITQFVSYVVEDDQPPKIFAVVELFGMAITQGNEYVPTSGAVLLCKA
jgi:hypothetical protein